MKNILKGTLALGLLYILVTGCNLSASTGLSAGKISETVKNSMQQKFDSDSPFKEWRLTVTGVKVEKQSETQYKGTATLLHEGEAHDVPVDITVNGENINWQVKPGGFGAIEQKENQRMR
jgi:hypothetical protein